MIKKMFSLLLAVIIISISICACSSTQDSAEEGVGWTASDLLNPSPAVKAKWQREYNQEMFHKYAPGALLIIISAMVASAGVVSIAVIRSRTYKHRLEKLNLIKETHPAELSGPHTIVRGRNGKELAEIAGIVIGVILICNLYIGLAAVDFIASPEIRDMVVRTDLIVTVVASLFIFPFFVPRWWEDEQQWDRKVSQLIEKPTDDLQIQPTPLQSQSHSSYSQRG